MLKRETALDRRLRSLNYAKWERKLELLYSQDVGLEAAII